MEWEFRDEGDVLTNGDELANVTLEELKNSSGSQWEAILDKVLPMAKMRIEANAQAKEKKRLAEEQAEKDRIEEMKPDFEKLFDLNKRVMAVLPNKMVTMKGQEVLVAYTRKIEAANIELCKGLEEMRGLN